MLRLLGPSNELVVSTGRGVGAHCIVDLWGASHLSDAKVLTSVGNGVPGCGRHSAQNIPA